MKNLHTQLILFCLFLVPGLTMAQVTVNTNGMLQVATPTGTSNYFSLNDGGQVYSQDMETGDMVFRPDGSTSNYILKLTDDANFPAKFFGRIDLGDGNLSGTLINANGDEAMWYNGTYFSWGFGGAYNYFGDEIVIGTPTNPGGYELMLHRSSPAIAMRGTGNSYIVTMDDAGSIQSYPFWRSSSSSKLHMNNSSSFNGTQLVLESDGASVGIGTSTPADRLEVNGGNIRINSASSKYLRFYDGTTQTGFISSLAGGNMQLQNTDGGSMYFNSQNFINLNVDGAGTFETAMRINTDGNVGVGTLLPSEKLDVDGNLEVNGYISMPYTGGNDMKISQSTGNMKIEKMRVTGNALIDIDALPLDGTSAASFRFFRNTNTTGESKFDVHWGDGTNGVNCRISGNGNTFLAKDYGNVGIGIGNGSYKLHVNGSAGKPGGGTWANASDRRLKKNIEDFTDGLETIRKIHPVSYQYNGMAGLPDGGDTYVGIIAQEMQEVAPYTIDEFTYIETEVQGQEGFEREVVSKEETYLNYDGTAVTYMLVNAVQELADENDALKEENEELKATLDDILERLEKIEDNVGNENPGQSDSDLNTHEKDVVLTGQGNEAQLAQNQPNPFNENTVIKYFLPEGSTGAHMNIFDSTGKLLKTVRIDEMGEGQINLRANSLPAGNYMYQLVTDNGVIGSKTMSLAK